MTQQPATEDPKSFFRNDGKLVCSMLVLYGLCILVLSVAALWGLNQGWLALSANATSTAGIVATQQVQGTATAIARTTELAKYAVVDTFDSNINQWRTGPEFGMGSAETPRITSGVYSWDIDAVDQEYAVIWVDFVPGNDYIKNYDTYVDTKFAEVPAGNPCSGLMFRKAPLGWDTGGYSFVLCRSGYFAIHYHNAKNGWQEIRSQYHSLIQATDWNRIEVLINGSHFVFLINSQIVYEMEDDRQPVGGVALMMIVEESGTKILFDNFGYQTRYD
jgi:hypothetical protein